MIETISGKLLRKAREEGIKMGRGMEHFDLTGIPLCTSCLKPYTMVTEYVFEPICKCHPKGFQLCITREKKK